LDVEWIFFYSSSSKSRKVQQIPENHTVLPLHHAITCLGQVA
jgi:hypothetical protein